MLPSQLQHFWGVRYLLDDFLISRLDIPSWWRFVATFFVIHHWREDDGRRTVWRKIRLQQWLQISPIVSSVAPGSAFLANERQDKAQGCQRVRTGRERSEITLLCRRKRDFAEQRFHPCRAAVAILKRAQSMQIRLRFLPRCVFQFMVDESVETKSIFSAQSPFTFPHVRLYRTSSSFYYTANYHITL